MRDARRDGMGKTKWNTLLHFLGCFTFLFLEISILWETHFLLREISYYRSFQNIKPRCRSHPACSKLFGPPKRQGPIFHNSQNDQDFPVSSQTTTTRQGSPRHQRRRHGERRRLGWNNGHQKPEGEREGVDEGQRVGCGGRQGGSEGPRRHGFARFTSACLLEQARVCVEAFENLIKA